MNPVSTQLILKENSEKFTGFGKAKAFIETSKEEILCSVLVLIQVDEIQEPVALNG